LKQDDALELLEGFEERADHVTVADLRKSTVIGDYFENIHKSLIGRGLVLLQGPRGCGKTHMMRYAWLTCIENEKKNLPLAIYVSFNRYLRLEPLLRERADALAVFQVWVLGRIIQAAHESSEAMGANYDVFSKFLFKSFELDEVISKLEKGLDLSEQETINFSALTIENTAAVIQDFAKFSNRSRSLILLDDAALTLTPEYLIEFFDIVRVLKRPDISLKASIYPGTTEFGPRFHATHEGKIETVWLSTDRSDYLEIMRNIAAKRYPDSSSINENVRNLLAFCAFGIPRSYLAMLREFLSGQYSTEQQAVNKIVQEHADSRLQEFRSLALKVPRLSILIDTGEEFYSRVVDVIKSANDELVSKDEKQTLVGIETDGITHLSGRMINLLTEVGLLFEHSQVSHGGPDRKYRRFTPHFSSLVSMRAFAGKSRGSSARLILDFLNRPLAKHPVRRQLTTLISNDKMLAMALNLPPCGRCETPRINEAQKFCHNCGARLVEDSIFTRCMKLPISNVITLTAWARKKLFDHGIKNIGDLISLQDPGTELRKINMVGSIRAEKIFKAVDGFVDEFLS
jgi:hypothetical protein